MIKKISDRRRTTISGLLNQYMIEKKWQEAKDLLTNELNSMPKDPIRLTLLSEVCYELGENKDAYKYAKKAYKYASACPLVISNHAYMLYDQKKNTEAIKLWISLLGKNINEKVQEECGENEEMSESLINDIRLSIAEAYLMLGNEEKALSYYTQHMGYRRRGQVCRISKVDIIKIMNKLKKQIKNRDQ